MNILVLGGDGFIGSHFVDSIIDAGHNIYVFDRFKSSKSTNLEHLKGKVHLISGELANREHLKFALANKDIIYHFISCTNPLTSWNDPYLEIADNLKNSTQLFELAAEAGVKKIVFPSSGGTIYGLQNGKIDETTLPKPFTPYGICKLTTEYILEYFHIKYNVSYDIYRIGNAFGPRQSANTQQGVIGVWMRHVMEGRELLVYGDDNTIRDYVYVKDVAYLMSHSLKDSASSGIYNIGSGVGISILELLQVFKTVIPKPFKYKVFPRRPSDNSSFILDPKKILSLFPDFQFSKLEAMICETWDFYNNTN